eukprot:GEMP01043447.1.p1 GENE.GEMP01043447.1~~GEMP01043447.1.p1  ORF type:complete len:232 (+),score=58.51 GEMP01043447.1:378-1073(+)
MTLLLLIDCQRAFVEGSWAQYFGEGQSAPIRSAMHNVNDFLSLLISGDSRRSAHHVDDICAIALTKCYLSPASDADLWPSTLPQLLETLAQKRCVPVRVFHKPDTNIIHNDAFCAWFNELRPPRVLIGGCTTTSCVRVSSQAIKQLGGDGCEVMVDTRLCGARSDNYVRPREDGDDPVPRNAAGNSSVDLALLQMKASGVHVRVKGAIGDEGGKIAHTKNNDLPRRKLKQK